MLFYEYAKQGEEILKILQSSNKNLVLYGTGSIGNFIGRIMEAFISCYCVTKTENGSIEFNGMPVYEVESLPFDPDNTTIILTLDSKHWDSVEEGLSRHGYKDVVRATLDYQNALLSYYYLKIFELHDVSLEEAMINLNGTHIRNPLKMDEVDFKSVLIEMNDLVMGDIFSDVSMWSEGPYQFDQVLLKEGDVVFDCGANLGLFSCIAASKGCVSYAFEPTKRLYDDLKICSDYYNNKIVPCNYALSDKTGVAELAMSPDWDVANTIVESSMNTIISKDGYEKYETVETITIDDFVINHKIEKVDFIKADIEGAERYMLLGAVKTLSKMAPRLAICTYHFKDDPQVLEEIIMKANPNYIVKHKWKKLYAYVK